MAVRSDVADNVVSTMARRVGVHGHFQVGCIFIGCASGGGHAGDTDPRSRDGPFGQNPWLRRSRPRDGATRCGKISVQFARSAAERSRVCARGGEVLTYDFAKQRIGRRGYRRAEGRVSNNAAGLRKGSAQRSEEHTSELQSHSFISYAVFCLKKKKET